MASNRELLSKLNDKLDVVKGLAEELDYNECTEDELEETRGLIETVEEIEKSLIACADAMDNTIEEGKEDNDDREFDEDEDDEVKE